MVAGGFGLLVATVIQRDDWKVVAVHGVLTLLGGVVTAWLAREKRREKQATLEFRTAILAAKKPSRSIRSRNPGAIPRRKPTK